MHVILAKTLCTKEWKESLSKIKENKRKTKAH